MALQEVGGFKYYKAWALWNEGDFILGKYVGSSVDNYGKPNYHIRISDFQFVDNSNFNPKKPDKEGIALEKDMIMGVNSCGALEMKMEQVTEGETVKIVFGGEGIVNNPKSAFHGKPFNKVDVFIDTEDSAPVATTEKCDEQFGEEIL